MSENIMRIIDLRGQNLSRAELLAAMPRAAMGTSEATDLVRPILDDVKERGAAALRDFEEKFDHVRPKNLRVPVEAIKDALTTLDPEVRAAIEESVRRARAVAANQVPKDFYTDLAEGARVAERWIPIQRVGLYVPGGKAVYPSSVIMNAVPAQAAGVESLAIATPPARDNEEGLPNKTILATCAILGVDEVYAVGGAQAIAMFAYGAKGSEPQDGEILCDPVDKITGPGNIFVATAKRMVSGIVGIDAVAGPTEIAIIADKGANPSWLAADLNMMSSPVPCLSPTAKTSPTRCRRASSTACLAPSTPSASTRRCAAASPASSSQTASNSPSTRPTRTRPNTLKCRPLIRMP